MLKFSESVLQSIITEAACITSPLVNVLDSIVPVAHEFSVARFITEGPVHTHINLSSRESQLQPGRLNGTAVRCKTYSLAMSQDTKTSLQISSSIEYKVDAIPSVTSLIIQICNYYLLSSFDFAAIVAADRLYAIMLSQLRLPNNKFYLHIAEMIND